MVAVSVIIPAYNPGRYLAEAVQSVLAQTYRDFEIIVVDDGSTEDLTSVARLSDKVSIIRCNRLGPSAARNTGILRARGEFIAFLDHDDLWLPGKLQLQLRTMTRHEEFALCFTDYQAIDADGLPCHHPHAAFHQQLHEANEKTIMEDSVSLLERSYLDLFTDVVFLPSSAMLRKSCLPTCGLFDPLYSVCEDLDLWLKIARANRIAHIRSCQVRYRLHGSNLSMLQGEVILQERLHILQKHWRLAVRLGEAATAKAAAEGVKLCGNMAFDYCRKRLRAGNFPAFLRYLCLAFRLSPGYVGASLARWLVSKLSGR